MRFLKGNLSVVIIISLVVIMVGIFTWSVVNKNIKEKASNNPAMLALTESGSGAAYTDMQGNPVPLSESVGEILIVNSWASWSPDSATELPILAKVSEDFSSVNIKIVAINRAEPSATAERFLNSIKVQDRVQLVLDPDDRFYKSIGGYSMPETIIYDGQGEVVFHARGVVTYETMSEQLKLLIESE